MIVPLLNSKTTVAVVLGASEWASAELGVQSSFARSAEEVTKYLSSKSGLNLPATSILNLFDNENPGALQLSALKKWLGSKLKGDAALKNVVVYFIGHGETDRFGHLSMLVRASDGQGQELNISAPHLAEVLNRHAPQHRRFVILDCCFSQAAALAFTGMSHSLDQAVAAVANLDLGEEDLDVAPGDVSSGTILLCSSSVAEVSLAPRTHSLTLFSGALIHVLTCGISRAISTPDARPSTISLADLRLACNKRMLKIFGPRAPQPVLTQTNAKFGDLSLSPLFPNPLNRPSVDTAQALQPKLQLDNSSPTRDNISVHDTLAASPSGDALQGSLKEAQLEDTIASGSDLASSDSFRPAKWALIALALLVVSLGILEYGKNTSSEESPEVKGKSTESPQPNRILSAEHLALKYDYSGHVPPAAPGLSNNRYVDLYFDFDKVTLEPESASRLDVFLKTSGQVVEKVILIGLEGPDGIAMALARADSAKKYLVAKGLSSESIRVFWRDAEAENSAAERTQNRRVQVVFFLAPTPDES